MIQLLRVKHSLLFLSCFILLFTGTDVRADVGSPTPEDSLRREMAMDHYLTGSLHEEAEELWQAVVEYQVAQLYDSTSAVVAMALAKAYLKLGYQDAAVKVLANARQSNPDNVELTQLLIEQYLITGRIREAADGYVALTKIGPLDQRDHLRYAAVLTNLQKFDETVKVYQDYIVRFGADTDLYERLGLIQLTQRDIAAAETTFERLVELDSTEYRIFFVLGGFAVARDDWASAEGYFRKALIGDSSNARVWANLVLALSEQNKYDAALQSAAAADLVLPDNPQILDLQAGALERLGRFDEALQTARKSISLDSTRVAPYMACGVIFQRRKQWELAAEVYERALAVAPDSPLALNNYAYMFSEQNTRLEQALDMVNRALKASPDTPSFIDTRGWIWFRMGKYQEALTEMKKALKGEPGNAELYYHIGCIYQALGKASKAKDAWSKARQLDPENEQYKNLAD